MKALFSRHIGKAMQILEIADADDSVKTAVKREFWWLLDDIKESFESKESKNNEDIPMEE